MDNVTHGCLGLITALLLSPPGLRKPALWVGLVAAELPDLDTLIKSAEDPLFSLQIHRHFTHSLLMVPVLAAVALALVSGVRRLRGHATPWKALIPVALVAALTHAFCDVWTSYGTHWFWPFVDRREAWDLISVIDPVMTLPLLTLVIWGIRRGRPVLAWWAVAWVATYLALCWAQQQRAASMVRQVVAQRGHQAERFTVKPSFGNIIVWRGLYVHQGTCFIVCARPGILGASQILGTSSAPLLDPAQLLGRPFTAHAAPLDPDSTLAHDVRRFAHFSDGWLGLHPQHSQVIADLRYAKRPDSFNPLWGIHIDPAAPEKHTPLVYFRRVEGNDWADLWQMIIGQWLPSPDEAKR